MRTLNFQYATLCKIKMVHPEVQYSNFATVRNIIYIEDGVPILFGPLLTGSCHHFF